jgi:hypothetical protein
MVIIGTSRNYPSGIGKHDNGISKTEMSRTHDLHNSSVTSRAINPRPDTTVVKRSRMEDHPPGPPGRNQHSECIEIHQ